MGAARRGGPAIDTAVLTIADFAAYLAEPAGLAEAAGAGGGVVAMVDLGGAPDQPPSDEALVAARTIPGVIVAVLDGNLTPATAAWADLTDVVLCRSDDDHDEAVLKGFGMTVGVGPDLDRQLAHLVASAAARPRAAAALALLLRGEARRIEDGLVAESAVYSMLQAGPEFSAWRAGRTAGPARPVPETSPPLTVVSDGHRMTVTLSRPERHNALNTAMRDALVEILAAGLVDEAVRVILQGEGPSFCSGGDLDDFGTAPDPATSHLIRLTRSPAALAARLGPRLEARVHGACIGAGVELAAFAGRVVADPKTSFALPELAFGLIPGAGGTVSLPRRIGRHRTAWLALTGERIDAVRARRWGLVDEIA
jgi:hypothetical protein